MNDDDIAWAEALVAEVEALDEARARIAELEAEVNHLQGENDRLRDVRESRIAELEVEVARLNAIEAEALEAQDIIREMNAALSGEETKK